MYSYYAALTVRPRRSLRRHPDDPSDAAAATDLISLFLRGLPRSPKLLYRHYCLRQQLAFIGWSPSGGRYSRLSTVRWRSGERSLLCSCGCDGGSDRESAEAIALLSEVERGSFAGKVGSCWENEELGLGDEFSAGEGGKVRSYSEESWDEEGIGSRRDRVRLGKEALLGKNSQRKVGRGGSGRVEKELGSHKRQERLREENRKLMDEIERISGEVEGKESIMEENRRMREEIERVLRASEAKSGVREENRRLREEMERVLRASEVRMDVLEENRRLREEMDKILVKVSASKENATVENRRLREDLGRMSRALEVKESIMEENKMLQEEVGRMLKVSEMSENMVEENRMLRAQTERLSMTSRVDENVEVENRRLREEVERLSRVSDVKDSTGEESRILADQVDRRLKVSEVREDIREENRKLREEIERISKTFEVNENVTKKSSYEELLEKKVEDRKQVSALTAGLLEEVTRQRQEINQLRDNYENLLRRSMVQDLHVVGMPAPSNSASSSRLEGGEVVSSSLATLVDELKRQSKVIEELSRSYRELALSTQVEKSDRERVFSSEKVFISHLQDREKVSNSSVTIIGGGTGRKKGDGQRGSVSYGASTSESSALEKPEDPSQGKYTSGPIGKVTPMGEHREHLPKMKSSELLSSGCNLNTSENAPSAHDRQFAESAEMREPHEGDIQWASNSGKVSVSQEEKVENKMFSSMTYIGDKKEKKHYAGVAGKLGIPGEKPFNSSHVSIGMEKASLPGVTSTMNVTNLHIEEKHVDEKIGSSSNYTYVAPANKPTTDSPQDQEEDPSVILVQEVDKENAESSLEKRTSESVALTATTSGDSFASYNSAEAHQGLDEQTRAEHLHQVRNGILESASHFDTSSSEHVGEFMTKVEQEIEGLIELGASTGSSGIHVEAASNVRDQGSSMAEEHKQKYMEEEPERGQSLASSELKGPSDEIWDLTNPTKGPPLADATQKEFSEVPAELTSLPSASGNAVIKRSAKSLWSYIAAMVRTGWHLHATSQTLTVRPGARSSSNESTSSDVWFSGSEHDEEGEQIEKRKVHSTKGRDPVKRTTGRKGYKQINIEADTSITIGSSEGFGTSKGSLPVTGSIDNLVVTDVEHGVLSGPQTELPFMGTSGEVDVSSDSSLMLDSNLRMRAETMAGASSSMQLVNLTEGGISSAMQLVNLVAGGTSSAMQSAVDVAAGIIPSAVQSVDLAATGISSSTQAVDLAAESVSSAAQTCDSSSQPDLPISTGMELELAGLDKVPKGRISMGKKPLEEGSLGIVESESKDGDLRRRLQRARHVPRERFGEWEEAKRLESERMKLDEFFMREALLEAKNAAESWEVPIGAVLVQDGKIIARGGNMVEQSRDSTSHAEMICIREASKQLKSWRLPETTLYVTLEPCAMCAGAILQARIDTVVWGAPNKLLGADGSWVRLFPGGDEETSTPSQTAGPIHPFHPKITIRRGVLEKECADIMQQFFHLRRKKDKKEEQPQPSRTSISAYPSKLITKMHNIFSLMFCL